MSEPVQEGVQPKGVQTVSDEERDAVLDRVFDKHGVTDPTVPGYESPETQQSEPESRVRDDKGRFKPKEEQPEPKAEKPTEPVEEPEAVPDSEELERALSAIRLDKVPQDVVSKLSTKEQIALGSAIRERRSAHDKALAELAELKKVAQNGAPTTAELESPPPPVDLADALKPFVAEFGEDAGDALKGLLEKAVLPKFQALEQTIQSLQQGSARSFLDSQRVLLRDSFPALAEAEAFSPWAEKAVQLAALPGYTDEQAAYDAARLLHGEPVTKEKRKAEARELRSRSDGQPTLGVENTPTPPRSYEDKRDQVLDKLLDGATKDEAAAAFR